MINFDNSVIENIVIHNVGNKYEGGELTFSKRCSLPDNEDILSLIKNHFTSAFKRDAFFQFVPYAGSLMNNPVYATANTIFGNDNDFYAQSIAIAEHLFEQSNEPDVLPGELSVVHFRNCNLDDGVCDAVGIFKCEKKDIYLKIVADSEVYQFTSDSGISLKKADKACMIFNMNAEQGYKILVLDKLGAKDKPYWTESFLGVEPSNDSYFATSNYLSMCKDFVHDVYNDDNDVSKADQIDLMNRSIDFFKEADLFTEDRFKREVVREPEIISAFEDFKKQYEQDSETTLEDTFAVSDHAIKDEKKNFKHVLKLDKNFHVYIHGQRKYIEKGYDPDKELSYYKLFFKQEE